MHARRGARHNVRMTVDPEATIPAVVIEKQVAQATSLDDLPGIIKSLTDRLQAVDARDTAQESRISAATGLVATLQSQMLWICAACLLFGAAAGYVLTKAVG